MKSSNAPLTLWDYCLQQRARINNMTANRLFTLHGSNPHTDLLHEEGDILNLCRFNFYEWASARYHKAPFPHNREVLCQVLGPASGEGNKMAQWILKSNGRVVPRWMVRPLRVEEMSSETEKQKCNLFDSLIMKTHGSPLGIETKNQDSDKKEEEWEPYEDEDKTVK